VGFRRIGQAREEDLWLSVIRRSGPCCLRREPRFFQGSSAATHGCSHLALSEHWNHLADFFPRSCVVRVLQETIVFSSRAAQLAGQLAVQVAAMLGLAGQLVAQLGGRRARRSLSKRSPRACGPDMSRSFFATSPRASFRHSGLRCTASCAASCAVGRAHEISFSLGRKLGSQLLPNDLRICKPVN